MDASPATSAPNPSLSARQPGVVERAIQGVTEWSVAALLVVEMLILLLGVSARYLFGHPLPWSDELASELFLWVAMFGAVIAVQRSQHMRILVLLHRVSPTAQQRLEAMSAASSLVVYGVLFYLSLRYTIHEAAVNTYALEISRAWRASAMPASFLLMTVLAFIQLGIHRKSNLVQAALVLGIVAGAIWASTAQLDAIGNYNLIVFFVLLVGAGVFAGIPIALVFLLATLLYLGLMTRVPVGVVVGRLDEGMAHLILLAVPLFVFLGKLMEETGLARSIMGFLVLALGHLRGGLSYVLLAAMYIVSGISGSKIADMAAVAPVLFPEMVRKGKKPGELVALLSASGAMSETIPPSLVLITTGVATGVSIEALFTAGLVPARVLAIVLSVVVWWRSRHEVASGEGWPSPRPLARMAMLALPGIGLPILIRTAVVEGVATATEVSTIGIFYSVIVGVTLYRPFPWARVKTMLVETASLTGAILLIVGAATGMAWALTQSGFSRALSEVITALPGGRFTFLAVTIVFFIILGSLLEGLPAIVIFGPLLFPAATAIGIHQVHYAIVVVLSMGLGLFIPPFGIGYWAACLIGQVDPDAGVRPLVPYMTALFIGVLVIAALPVLSIGLLK